MCISLPCYHVGGTHSIRFACRWRSSRRQPHWWRRRWCDFMADGGYPKLKVVLWSRFTRRATPCTELPRHHVAWSHSQVLPCVRPGYCWCRISTIRFVGSFTTTTTTTTTTTNSNNNNNNNNNDCHMPRTKKCHQKFHVPRRGLNLGKRKLQAIQALTPLAWKAPVEEFGVFGTCLSMAWDSPLKILVKMVF